MTDENENNTNGAQSDDNSPRESDTSSGEDDGNSTDNTSLLAKSIAAAERMEQANKKTEELIARQEKLQAEKLLGGTSGGNVEIKQKEETDKEYSDRIDKEIREGKYND